MKLTTIELFKGSQFQGQATVTVVTEAQSLPLNNSVVVTVPDHETDYH